MAQKQHYVVIKGTKEGLNLVLDDTCSFQDLLGEIKEKLSTQHVKNTDGQSITVHLKIGNRYLTESQEKQIRSLIQNNKSLAVETIESNVITKKQADEERKNTQIVSVSKIIRSGQVLEIQGDLLLVGDVNPGGTVKATGNIFIMGSLKGIAHAGANGNRDAVVSASVMEPSQLRIADLVRRAPDQQVSHKEETECAFIGENQEEIVVDRVQVLTKIRPNLTRL
ncbi:septum site-determining protein MinC [Pseudalkalibacillus caeni]|uniref:Probable septum site-determining protein MinC n=1 Tax=Exobacillus caeni TaxID=2574798 RepID=A0A5R9FB19_9BACL|nr:septum site-determining protein MinC [Pseudalkalibacillus caeni]TLS39420.1 septum site-determining protein MinC [Pseudalkalibacillus caeni]